MVSSKRKCLLILPRFPYPAVGGDKLKSYNLVRILNLKYELFIYIITDEKITSDVVKFLKDHSAGYKVFYRNKFYFRLNALKNIFSNRPIQVSYYYFRAAQEEIDRLLLDVDFAIANLVRTSEYLASFNKPKFLDIVDSIALNYIRSRSKATSLFWKFIYQVEAKRLLQFEKQSVSTFHSTFFVNYDECRFWSKYGNTVWIPNGVNPALFAYGQGLAQNVPSNVISFLGKMDYQPNVDAVCWFANMVLPKLNGEIRFLIIGARPNSTVRRLSRKSENVNVVGFVDDPYELLGSSFAVVAPMRTGGGIQNKILEAMGLGKIVITTSLGALPIKGAEHGVHLLIGNTPEELVKLVEDVFKNPNKFVNIGLNARTLVEKIYTWQKYENKLFSITEAF